jgi:hypothetical protein
MNVAAEVARTKLSERVVSSLLAAGITPRERWQVDQDGYSAAEVKALMAGAPSTDAQAI